MGRSRHHLPGVQGRTARRDGTGRAARVVHSPRRPGVDRERQMDGSYRRVEGKQPESNDQHRPELLSSIAVREARLRVRERDRDRAACRRDGRGNRARHRVHGADDPRRAPLRLTRWACSRSSLTGPPGAGKPTALEALSDALHDDDIRHASLEMDAISWAHPDLDVPAAARARPNDQCALPGGGVRPAPGFSLRSRRRRNATASWLRLTPTTTSWSG